MIRCLFSFLDTISVSALKRIAAKDTVHFFTQTLSKLHYLTMGTDKECPHRLLL